MIPITLPSHCQLHLLWRVQERERVEESEIECARIIYKYTGKRGWILMIYSFAIWDADGRRSGAFGMNSFFLVFIHIQSSNGLAPSVKSQNWAVKSITYNTPSIYISRRSISESVRHVYFLGPKSRRGGTTTTFFFSFFMIGEREITYPVIITMTGWWMTITQRIISYITGRPGAS